MKLFTIGSNGKNLRKFAEMLQAAGVTCVIDIRLQNTSQLAGYAKMDDLEFALELLGIGYEHHPELAPTEDILSAYKKSKDSEAYRRAFEKLIKERDMLSIGREILSRVKSPCLLCAEDDPSKCHRRLVAENWAANLPDVELEHLR